MLRWQFVWSCSKHNRQAVVDEAAEMASSSAHCAVLVSMCAPKMLRNSEYLPSRAARRPGFGSPRPFRCKYSMPALVSPAARAFLEKPRFLEMGTSRTSISRPTPLRPRLAIKSSGLVPSYPIVKSFFIKIGSRQLASSYSRQVDNRLAYRWLDHARPKRSVAPMKIVGPMREIFPSPGGRSVCVVPNRFATQLRLTLAPRLLACRLVQAP